MVLFPVPPFHTANYDNHTYTSLCQPDQTNHKYMIDNEYYQIKLMTTRCMIAKQHTIASIVTQER
jgi:hypothetical protein